MKPLILSFFLVLLGVSLFTKEEKEVESEQPQQAQTAYESGRGMEEKVRVQTVDSIVITLDKTAKTL